MVYKIVFADRVLDYLDDIDVSVRTRILKKIDFYANSGNPLKFAKQLNDEDQRYRFRIGDYRVIFKVTSKSKITILYILSVGHRKDIYK